MRSTWSVMSCSFRKNYHSFLAGTDATFLYWSLMKDFNWILVLSILDLRISARYSEERESSVFNCSFWPTSPRSDCTSYLDIEVLSSFHSVDSSTLASPPYHVFLSNKLLNFNPIIVTQHMYWVSHSFQRKNFLHCYEVIHFWNYPNPCIYELWVILIQVKIFISFNVFVWYLSYKNKS